MEPLELLKPIIQAANAANAEVPGDFVDDDGLLCCGRCHTPKQSRKALMGKEVIVGCMCDCSEAKWKQEKMDKEKQDEADRIMRQRNTGISNISLRNASFAADDGKNPAFMAKLRNYVENWAEMKKSNTGLLLYGDTGTGKSYGAACIANALIEQHIPACMINLSTILNDLGGYHIEDKNAYIANLMRYHLLIIDDFGMERQTEYALEQVFNIIDARCRTGMPLIITTNLTVAEIQNPQDMAHKRIYDRIDEMCLPIMATGHSRRKEKAAEKVRIAANLLLGG